MNSELQFEPFDDKGKVICQICGKSFQVISPRHLNLHKIEYADYRKRYPNAPLSCDEFIARSKYGKTSGLFVNDADLHDCMLEEETVEEEVELDDLEFETAMKKVVEEIKDPAQNQKMAVLDHLRLHYANVEKDYRILHKSPITKKYLFDFITDFSDAVLKIVFDFPDTFWHNRNPMDPLREKKLKDAGWKILVIKGRAPGPGDIDDAIDSM